MKHTVNYYTKQSQRERTAAYTSEISHSNFTKRQKNTIQIAKTKGSKGKNVQNYHNGTTNKANYKVHGAEMSIQSINLVNYS